MARRLSSHVLLVLTLVALLLPLSSSPPLQAKQAPPAVHAAPSIPSSPDSISALEQNTNIRINEVMPKQEEGDYEWVELYNPKIYLVYLPLILRNSYANSTSTHSTLAPQLASSSLVGPLDISGWQITDEDGNTYSIPDALPPVPRDAFVLVLLDGLGSAADDYDFSEGLAVLHSLPGTVDIFEDGADQVALYSSNTHSPETIVDFVAWGEPPRSDAANASAADIWQDSWQVSLFVGSGGVVEGEDPVAGQSVGLYPGHNSRAPDDWALFRGDDVTEGSANPIPRAYWTTVADGVEMASDDFALGWSWAPGAGYQLQIDDDQGFGSPLVDLSLDVPWYTPEEPLPPGDYWWRVRAIDPDSGSSAWSEPLRVGVIEAVYGPAADGRTVSDIVAVQYVLPDIQWLRQRKDTRLLCLDGCPDHTVLDPYDPQGPWDWPHFSGRIYGHGANNCVRAAIAMIVTNYGGNLSQDRLSYQLFENGGDPITDEGKVGDPQVDLGHDLRTNCCGLTGSATRELMAWALGVDSSVIFYTFLKPTFQTIRDWLDEGRPILRVWDGHATVVVGYFVFSDGTEIVRLYDPWDGTKAVKYDSLNFGCLYVPPASAPDVRSDEPEIRTDYDGDGIMDWDEANRFPTAQSVVDSDWDRVGDKIDMREYVLDASGKFAYREPDGVDHDGLRKEVDPDNDNGGSQDGCEDTHPDGVYRPDQRETDNFDPNDDTYCPDDLHFLAEVTGEPWCDDVCSLLFGFDVIQYIFPKPNFCRGESYLGDPKEIVWLPSNPNADSNLHVGDIIEVYGECWLDLGYLPAVSIRKDLAYFLRKVY